MNDENILETEQIEKYLEGKLSPEEQQAFERRLSTEAPLAEQVNLQRKAVAKVKSSGRADMLQLLREEDTRMPAYQPTAKVVPLSGDTRQKLYWAVAAAVLLLLIPFVIIYKGKQESQQLFTEYFAPYSGQGESSPDLPEQARNLYEGQNYAQALPVLERMLSNERTKAAVLFYKGNSHLALEHVPEAIASFEAVLALPANEYSEEAQWYLALGYVKNNQVRKAKKLLREISQQTSHPFRDDAQKLLDEL